MNEVKAIIAYIYVCWKYFVCFLMFDICSNSRSCPLANTTTNVTQACLNQTVLAEPGSGTTRFFIETIAPASTGMYTIRLLLPSQITCDNCVLQWFYNTGQYIYIYISVCFNCIFYFSSPCLNTHTRESEFQLFIACVVIIRRIFLQFNCVYIIMNNVTIVTQTCVSAGLT